MQKPAGTAGRDFLGTLPIGRLLVRMALPATIGMVINALYNIVDALFVGRGVGPLAIGGLAVSFPLQILIFGVGLTVGTGAASIISRALGAGDVDRASRALGTAYALGIVAGLAILVIGKSFLPAIVNAFGATPAIAPLATEYLDTILYGAPFIVLGVSSNHMVRAEGHARVSMFAMVIGAGTNIVLDYLFIFVLGMGIQGAALATVIGRGLSATFLVVFVLTGSTLKLNSRTLVPSTAIMSAILALGLSSFVRQIGGSIMGIVINNVLRAQGGDFYLSAFGIVNRIIIFGFMPLFGVAQGFQPIAGFNYGAGKMDRVREVLKLSVVVTTVMATLFYLLVMIFPAQLAALFTREEQVIGITVDALRRILAALPFLGVQVIGAVFFLTIGKAVPSLFLNLSRQIIFLIPLILILPRFFGVNGTWLAFPAADLLSTALTVTCLLLVFRRLRAVRRAQ